MNDKELKLQQLKETRIQIGERIRLMREKYGIDRTHLAAEFGLAPNLIGQYERGISSPQPLTMVKLAEKFHTTTDFLMCKTDDPTPAPNDLIKVDEMLEKAWVYKGVELTEEEKKKLYSILETGIDLLKK